MILVDTSVWVDHLRRGDPELQEMLERGSVLIHPFVIGEIACGHLRSRQTVLGLLAGLRSLMVASHAEVLHLLDAQQLAGSGIGYVDAHLLAALKIHGLSKLWTRDRALLRVAESLGLGHGLA